MRPNYPLISFELNDMFQDLYYKLVYILGYDNEENETTYTGKYDKIEINLRESVYKIINQLDSYETSLVLYKGTTQEIPLFSKWNKYIIINELRSL